MIKKDFNRQSVIVAMVAISFADLASGVDLAAIELPPNAIVLGGDVTVTEAFNSATTDVIDVGDSVSQNRYLNDGNIHAAGRVALVPTGYVHPGGDLTVRWVGAGAAPTAGTARLTVQYVVQGRSNSTQG